MHTAVPSPILYSGAAAGFLPPRLNNIVNLVGLVAAVMQEEDILFQ